MNDALYVAPDEAGALLAAAGAVAVLGEAAGVVVVVGVLVAAGCWVEEAAGAAGDDEAGRHCEYQGLE